MPIHIQLETFLPKQPEFDNYKYRPRVILIFFIDNVFIIIVVIVGPGYTVLEKR